MTEKIASGIHMFFLFTGLNKRSTEATASIHKGTFIHLAILYCISAFKTIELLFSERRDCKDCSYFQQAFKKVFVHQFRRGKIKKKRSKYQNFKFLNNFTG